MLYKPLTGSQQTAGQGYDGLLRGAILRNFEVIFDYSRSRMILEPRLAKKHRATIRSNEK